MTAVRERPGAPEAAAGTVGRRRGLPTGRALAGGFFVAAAVVIVLAAWLAGTGRSGRPWVIAGRNLPAGARVGAGDLTTATMTLPAGTTARLAFHDPAQIVGRVLDAPLRGGELVQAGDLSPAPGAPALRPVTVSVAPTDVSDLSDGSLVDVIVTDGSDPSSPTSVIVTGARVLTLARPSAGLVSGSGGAQVTLGVSTLEQVTTIVHAAHTGTLSVVAGAPGDQPSAAPAAGGAGAKPVAGASGAGGP